MLLLTLASIFHQQINAPRWLVDGFLGRRDPRIELTRGLIAIEEYDVLLQGFENYFARNRETILSPANERATRIAELEELRKRATDSAQLLALLSALYEQSGDRAKAAEYRAQSLRIDPDVFER
jgi:hypothetical protein